MPILLDEEGDVLSRDLNSGNEAAAVQPPRLLFIDAMRGIGILLVVMGHVTRNSSIYAFIYSFHMPLFFAVSGFLFKPRSISDLLRRRISTLIAPYVAFASLTFVYWRLIESCLRGGNPDVFGALFNIIIASGGPERWSFNSALWFLPCLFVTELAYSLISVWVTKWCKYKKYDLRSIRLARLMQLLICIAVGSVWLIGFCGSSKPRLPWMVDVMPAALPFFALGALVSTWSDAIVRLSSIFERNKIFGICTSLLGYASLFIIVNDAKISINYMELIFPDPAILLLVGCLGVFATYVLASTMSTSRALSYLGRDSLSIMGLHEPIKRAVIVVGAVALGAEVDQVRQDLLTCIVLTCLTIAMSCVAGHIFSRIESILNKAFLYLASWIASKRNAKCHNERRKS